ncbi:TPA: hypothetical protein QHC12_002182 [Aeromonas hydrophila subsp. hydrophila]|nr:hypothetical protein [Aeromonas hydrophila subsp. hydrophila]
MSAIKPERLTLEDQLKAELATLQDIAEVKRTSLRQYQTLLVTMRRGNKPRPKYAIYRLLFECRVERRARLYGLEALATAVTQYAKWYKSEEGSA